VSERGWALILGASSGFGAAAAMAFARDGYDIIGVHLDRRAAAARVESLIGALRETGQRIHFFNNNAASDDARTEMLAQISALLAPAGRVRVLLHSLAFGTLRPFIAEDEPTATRRQIEMTVDVMAHSLVYWVQDLKAASLLDRSRIFAMTSAGSHQVWANYGPVSAAKATLESHVRQLSMELAPAGHTINAILAGVTDTPALAKIPGADDLKASALRKNPHNRLTQPEDVAACLVELARPGTYWMTGNTIRVDGGEDVCA
jgi:enoyl-[acyl-carrier protein] reductase III